MYRPVIGRRESSHPAARGTTDGAHAVIQIKTL
jgi:hypothetical protein